MNPLSKSEKEGLTNRSTSWVKRSKTNDAALATAATDAIECLTTVPLEPLHVTARNGWLHLGGTVSRETQRITVEEVTRHLTGVRGVVDSNRHPSYTLIAEDPGCDLSVGARRIAPRI